MGGRENGASDVLRGAGAPDLHPRRRGRHGVAGASIGLENAPALFGARWCEPILATGPQKATGAAMGAPVEML
jgi:hypothetical protein